MAAVLAAVAAADAFEGAAVEGDAHHDLGARHAFHHQVLLHCGVDRQAERAGEGAGQLFPAPAQIGFAQRVVEGRPGRVTEQRRPVVGYLLPWAGQIVGHQVDVIEWRDDLRQLAVIARQESAAGAGDGQLVWQRGGRR